MLNILKLSDFGPINSEIGIARLWGENLTSSEKCRREGLEGSLACQFEYDYPEQAAKVRILRKSFSPPVLETSKIQFINVTGVDWELASIPVILCFLCYPVMHNQAK